MIGNYDTRREIGSYLDSSKDNSNFENIKFSCDELFINSSEAELKNKKNKKELEKYIIFYTLINSGTFYLAVVPKNSLYTQNDNLIFELFEDVENRGIKKLVNNNGVLTNIGNQNLKFCIEQDQEKIKRTKDNSSSISELFRGKIEKDNSKLKLISNELNDIQNNVKESVKNIINNVTEMQDLDDKSGQIKDISFKFKNDSTILERKVKYRKILHKAMLVCILSIIIIIVLYFIFK